MPNLPHITRSACREATGGRFGRTHLFALEPLHAGWQVSAISRFRGHRRRRLAEKDPDIAAGLRYVARQLQAEAEDLIPRDTERAVI